MASEGSSSSVDPNDVYTKFTASELFWKDRQQFLQSRGYMLRPRYRPGWIPSWKMNPTMKILHAEDRLSFRLGRSHLMDATSVSDGKLILIKRVVSNSPELHIATFLSSEELRKDPRNHCVPILDAFVDAQEPAISFIVMPFLRPIDKPEFDTVGSILNCVDQFLEGLVFLHEHNVAHRDCAYNNVMMDASAMYPQGFHPIAPSLLPNDVSRLAPVMPRASVPVTYYYVDFGISTLFTPEETNRMVTGLAGLDRDVPELSKDVPYDPFKVDIFILGNLFKQSFLDKFSNVDILSPLISFMLKHDPVERPSATEALRHFREISQSVWAMHRLWRAKLRGEDVMTGSILDTLSLISTAYKCPCAAH